MPLWRQKKVDDSPVFSLTRPAGIGELLRQQREEKGLSLSQVSKKILIPQRYLQALEQEEWQLLPGKVYAQNFLKRYAEELNLDSEGVVKLWQKQAEQFFPSSVNSLQQTLPLTSTHFWVIPRLLRNLALAVAVLGLAGYLIYGIIQFISPPQLVIYSPVDRQVVTNEPQVVVKGKTEPEAEVKINGERVPILEGRFEEVIDLQKGLNTITIRAQKKYSKPKIEKLLVVWSEESISKN